MNRFCFGLLLLVVSFVGCKDLPISDVEGRNSAQTSEKIAVLAYGSLILEPQNPTNNVTLETDGNWLPLDIEIPVSLTRLSSIDQPTERATRVIDTIYGTSITPKYASSTLPTLAKALTNLAGREGALKIHDGYKLDNMYYVRKVSNLKPREPHEEEITGVKDWVLKINQSARQKLSDETISNLVQWASKRGFTAIIWASFPANRTIDEIRARLKQKPQTLKNTKAYINNLPKDMIRTAFEQEIINMS